MRRERATLLMTAVLLAGLVLAAQDVAAPVPAEKVQRALAALADNDAPAAEKLASEAVAADPDATRAWLIVAAARERMGAYTKAEQAYRRFLSGCHSGVEQAYALEQINRCLAASSSNPAPQPPSRQLTPAQAEEFAEVYDETFTESGEHFVVHARNSELAKFLVRQAEQALARVCRGILSGQDFPHMASIHVWPDADEYRRNATPAAEWAGGSFSLKAGPDGETLRRIDLTQRTPEGGFDLVMLDRVLPHEMCHLVLADYFGDAHCPLSLKEGLAMMAEASVDNSRLLLAGVTIGSEGKIELPQLLALERPDKGQADLFYAESFSLLNYLHGRMNHRQFRDFLAHVKAGCSFDEALQRAMYVPNDARFFARLEEAWEADAVRQGQFLRALDQPEVTRATP